MNRVLLTLMLMTFALPVFAQSNISPVKAGVLLPFSGPYKTLGQNVLQSIELASLETGISLVVLDSASEKLSVAKSVEKLNSDGVDFIVGPIGSKNSRQAVDAAQRLHVPIFVLGSDNNINQRSAWAFRIRTSPQEQARAIADVAYRDLKLRKAGVLFPQTEYGQRAARAFVDRFDALGGTTTAIGSYDPETTDFKDPLKELVGRSSFVGKKKKIGKKKSNRYGYINVRSRKAIDFDCVFVPDFSHRVARLLPFFPLVGLQNGEGGDGVAVQLLGLGGWQGKTMEFAGSVAAGAIVVDTFVGDSDGGRAEEFVRTFENATERQPEDVDAEVFDLVWMLGKTHKYIRFSDLKKRRATIVSSLPFRKTWEGITGELMFAPDGAPIRKFNVYRFDENGEVTPVF